MAVKKAQKQLSEYYIGEQWTTITAIANRYREYPSFQEKYGELTAKLVTDADVWTDF